MNRSRLMDQPAVRIVKEMSGLMSQILQISQIVYWSYVQWEDDLQIQCSSSFPLALLSDARMGGRKEVQMGDALYCMYVHSYYPASPFLYRSRTCPSPSHRHARRP